MKNHQYIHKCDKTIEKSALLTSTSVSSDPPSSCSAGPIGEDLVRPPSIQPDIRSSKYIFAHKTIWQTEIDVGYDILILWLRIVPLASNHHGSCKSDLILLSLAGPAVPSADISLTLGNHQ
jgi:hypothetical protein